MTIDTRQQLLGTINSQIKLNGTGAITGPILNNVLDTMVNSALFQTGEWSQYTSYAPLDIAEYAGNAYIANVANVNASPVLNPTTWTPFSSNAAPTAANVSYTAPYTGAVTETVQAKLAQTVSVKDFGAVGDGVTDDTAAIQAADTQARSRGASLYFPGATYAVSQLIVYSNSTWYGDGRNNTIIKQIIGSNKDLIYGYNSNANWGSATPSNFVVGWSIKNMTFNGNWNTGSGNTSGSGIAVYGCRPIMEDVFITNVAEHGLRTEYVDSVNGGIDTFTMEGYLSDIRIDVCGKHGWWNNGPHDTVTISMVVVDAGQAATNTYDGFYYDAKSNGKNIALHAWTRSTANRMRFALNLRPGSTHGFDGNCNFEGAYSACVGIFSQKNLFGPTTRYYNAWNGVTVYLGLTATVNIIKGEIDGPGPGRPASIGILLGSTAGDFIQDNEIDVIINNSEAGNIVWNGLYAGGNNRIRGNCYNLTSATFFGSPSSTDDVDVMFLSNGVTSHLNNRRQRTTISIGASSTATWTFPIPFSTTPTVVFSILNPSASVTNPMWISSVNSTSVIIYNPNAVTANLTIFADAAD